MADLFDVLEVQIREPNTVRLIERDKDEKNADAVIAMAVARRGVADQFYVAVPAGLYKDGDPYSRCY